MRNGIIRRLTMATCCGIALAGCGDSTGPKSIVGSYTLQTVNGGALPYILSQSGANKTEILSGAFTLNADHTFSDQGTVRITQSGVATTTAGSASGTYVQNNTAITLTYSDNSVDMASINGKTMTLISDGVTLVYTR